MTSPLPWCSVLRASRRPPITAIEAPRVEGGTPTILITDTDVTAVHNGTGEILSEHDIEPTKTYWRNKQKEPGHRPDSQQSQQ
ncbi:hypothetical protein GCM10011575_42940 [Microlunatus endophyticus]|uniref:Uncharacterized protein n=1 Tax=Microlunatus endophyticus TaxID=1716077 RepID=A0A917SHL2_9ACTN|nr:hypothetical protein [Microlunatus endophyticus]GGL80091.1 hypothetical protein GCM10011575_42940 [Microlunatus endophyticus]